MRVQGEMGERQSGRRCLSEGFLCTGSAGTRPSRDWEGLGRSSWEPGGASPGPFVPLAPSHGFSDTCKGFSYESLRRSLDGNGEEPRRGSCP